MFLLSWVDICHPVISARQFFLLGFKWTGAIAPSFFILYVYAGTRVCLFDWVWARVYVGIHAHVCMWRPKVDLGCSQYCPPPYSWPMVSHRNWSSPVVVSLASPFIEIPCPCCVCLLSPGVICGPTYSPSFYMGARGINSGPCVASA